MGEEIERFNPHGKKFNSWLERKGITPPTAPEWVKDYAEKLDVYMTNVDEIYAKIIEDPETTENVRLRAMELLQKRHEKLIERTGGIDTSGDKPIQINFNVKKVEQTFELDVEEQE